MMGDTFDKLIKLRLEILEHIPGKLVWMITELISIPS
jgi:hypothetical protein